MLWYRQIVPLILGDERSLAGAAIEYGDEPSVYFTIRESDTEYRYHCDPLHKTPAESLVVGIDIADAIGTEDVQTAIVSYVKGHGLTFDTSAVWFDYLYAVGFNVSGGRPNTRHVLLVTIVTSEAQIIKVDCPIEVVE